MCQELCWVLWLHSRAGVPAEGLTVGGEQIPGHCFWLMGTGGQVGDLGWLLGSRLFQLCDVCQPIFPTWYLPAGQPQE